MFVSFILVLFLVLTSICAAQESIIVSVGEKIIQLDYQGCLIDLYFSGKFPDGTILIDQIPRCENPPVEEKRLVVGEAYVYNRKDYYHLSQWILDRRFNFLIQPDGILEVVVQ